MARPDHWLKHIFMVPGVILGLMLRSRQDMSSLWADPLPLIAQLLAGFIAACAAASANYMINEWLDAESDRHHPSKSLRPAVHKEVSAKIVLMSYVGLAVTALGVSAWLSTLFLVCIVAFLLSGLIYNVPPVRSKDRAYLDVATEAVNNPLRLTLGWAIVAPHSLPPSSLLLAFWAGGGFLMAVKRLAEYRSVVAKVGLEQLGLYRRSFREYTEKSLLLSSFLYAQLAAFFLAVFLIKYRIEYLLALPFFAMLFACYLWIGLKEESIAQAPERLLRERMLVSMVAILVLVLGILTWLDLPWLDKLTDPHYIEVPF